MFSNILPVTGRLSEKIKHRKDQYFKDMDIHLK